MKLILSVDTEADNQWETGASLTTTNLEHVPRFQALCERFELFARCATGVILLQSHRKLETHSCGLDRLRLTDKLGLR